MPRPSRLLALAVLAASASCGRADRSSSAPDAAVTPEPPPPSPSATADAPEAPAAPRAAITLIAAGDVSFGRIAGQMLLRDPSTDFFGSIRPWLASADVRFANLEGPLSEQKGETQSPTVPLVFTGPPSGADALARAGFTLVSTANNHAWDYGERALIETIENLDRAGVVHAGTGRDREASRRAAVVDVGGFHLAVIAVTDIWNQGPLVKHRADAFVGRAEEADLAAAVKAARAGAEAVIVSYHGGVEYTDTPITRTRGILHAAIDAGADAVIGHHPHVIQGVEWYRGKPILYSLGNLLMRMHRDHPWTELGYMGRLELHRGAPPGVEACPFRIAGLEVKPFAGDKDRAAHERRFFDHLRSISVLVGGVTIGAPGADGCARLSPP
jgi:poly-gamma-glutamate synthesis protein (capsule biosynthesis protein)